MTELLNNKEQKFIVVNTNTTDKMDLLKELGGKMLEAGYVEDTYTEAVCEREKVYPTGLPTPGVGIAIPHTDSIHVKEKAIILGILDQPVEFMVMGSTDEFVDAGLVFMLAIEQPHAQLEMLQKLIAVCQDQDSLKVLKEHTDMGKVEEIMSGLMA